jgi:type VI secretion system protein ImpA
MAPPFLDLDALLAPVPGGDPAGAVPRAERGELDEGRREHPDPDDPASTVAPDWPKLAAQARNVLTARGKDLVVATRLVEAVFRQHGFAALPEGFVLLRRLVSECWDRLLPLLDEDGVEPRASALAWLFRSDRGAAFPGTVRVRALFTGKEGAYGHLDWQRAQEGRPGVNRADIDAAVTALPLAEHERLAADLARSLEELKALGEVLREKMGDEAPDTGELGRALQSCHQLVDQTLKKKRPPEAPAPGEGPPTDGDGGAAPSRTGAPTSRAAAYRQLAEAADVLRQLEPHSPIPYLIQRAVALGALPFPELIKELVREEKILAELRRELGIAAPAGE